MAEPNDSLLASLQAVFHPNTKVVIGTLELGDINHDNSENGRVQLNLDVLTLLRCFLSNVTVLTATTLNAGGSADELSNLLKVSIGRP